MQEMMALKNGGDVEMIEPALSHIHHHHHGVGQYVRISTPSLEFRINHLIIISSSSKNYITTQSETGWFIFYTRKIIITLPSNRNSKVNYNLLKKKRSRQMRMKQSFSTFTLRLTSNTVQISTLTNICIRYTSLSLCLCQFDCVSIPAYVYSDEYTQKKFINKSHSIKTCILRCAVSIWVNRLQIWENAITFADNSQHSFIFK